MKQADRSITSLQRQINMYAGIFGVVVAVALGGYALIFSKIDVLEVSTAKIEEKISSIEGRLSRMETSIADIANDTQEISRSMAGVEKNPANAIDPLVAKIASGGLAAIDTDTLMQLSPVQTRSLIESLPKDVATKVVEECRAIISDPVDAKASFCTMVIAARG